MIHPWTRFYSEVYCSKEDAELWKAIEKQIIRKQFDMLVKSLAEAYPEGLPTGMLACNPDAYDEDDYEEIDE